MMEIKEEQLPKGIQNFDLKNIKEHQFIIQKDLSRSEVTILLKRIKKELMLQNNEKIENALKLLQREIKSKYSIVLSNRIIDKFVTKTNLNLIAKDNLDFNNIQKEIKYTVEEINRKKHFLEKKQNQQNEKPYSADKKKRRNIINCNTTNVFNLKSVKNMDELFLKEKLFILKQFIGQDQFKKTEEQLSATLQKIDAGKYGKHAENIKNYTAYDFILQKIFSLIQEDTKNIAIRQKYYKLYRKMKEQMVAIVTNEQQINNIIKQSVLPFRKCNATKQQSRQALKKHYYQLQRDKHDLTTQIQQTLESATKIIKEALIKRGRPDYAYQMELSLQNRATPFNFSRRKI